MKCEEVPPSSPCTRYLVVVAIVIALVVATVRDRLQGVLLRRRLSRGQHRKNK